MGSALCQYSIAKASRTAMNKLVAALSGDGSWNKLAATLRLVLQRGRSERWVDPSYQSGVDQDSTSYVSAELGTSPAGGAARALREKGIWLTK